MSEPPDLPLALHLGAHKTASTHLQKTLRAAAPAMAARGLLWLGPAELRGSGLRLGLVAAGAPGAGAAARALRAALASQPAALLSEENILGTPHAPRPDRAPELYPQADARLERVLAAADRPRVRLFLGLRDPAGFLTSAYGQSLLGGQIAPFADWLGGVAPEALRWSGLVARLRTLPGVAGVVLWRFEEYPAVLPALLAALLPADLAAQLRPAAGVTHPGLSARAQAQVMAALAAGTAGPETAQAARRLYPKGPQEPGFLPFDAAVRAASAAAYAADLARMAAWPAVRLLRPDPPPDPVPDHGPEA